MAEKEKPGHAQRLVFGFVVCSLEFFSNIMT